MRHQESGHSCFSTKYDLGVMRAKLPDQSAKARGLFGSGMIGAINNEIASTGLHCLKERRDMVVVWGGETKSQIQENGLNGNIPDNIFKSPQFRIREAFFGKLSCLG
jgi:hypothetical protein